MADPKDLFTSAMSGGNIRRYGELAIVAMPNMGLVTSHQDLQQAQSWARSKLGSTAVHKDRMRLVERLELVIGRVGSGCATRGGNKAIAKLVTIMKQAGMDLESWMIPRAVMEELFPPRTPVPTAKPAAGTTG